LVEDWQYEFNSTTNFIQIRKKGQRAIALWIPYNEIKGWRTLQEGQKYIYPPPPPPEPQSIIKKSSKALTNTNNTSTPEMGGLTPLMAKTLKRKGQIAGK